MVYRHSLICYIIYIFPSSFQRPEILEWPFDPTHCVCNTLTTLSFARNLLGELYIFLRYLVRYLATSLEVLPIEVPTKYKEKIIWTSFIQASTMPRATQVTYIMKFILFPYLEKAVWGKRKIKMERSKLKMSWFESNSRSLYDGVCSFLYLEAVWGKRKIKHGETKTQNVLDGVKFCVK